MHNDIMVTGFRERLPMLATGRYAQWSKGKKVVKPVTPLSESTSNEDNDEEQAQRDKQIQKSLALIAKHFKNIYKPINNNLRTSSNTRNKNRDISPRNMNDNQKPKRVKDYAYYKEKMMLCKHEDKGVPLSVDQGDWLDDTDEEPDKHELEAHYMYMEKIQEVFTTESRPKFDAEPLEKVQFDDHYNVFANERQYSEQPKSINDTYVVEKVDRNVISYSSNMCDNDGKDDQNAKEYKDKCDVLANLILNLKLDTDENKKIQKQLKKENASLTNELKECKSTLIESNDVRDRGKNALHHKEVELE
nr:hypothetical protein [Tanacetum cinerariifolium]